MLCTSIFIRGQIKGQLEIFFVVISQATISLLFLVKSVKEKAKFLRKNPSSSDQCNAIIKNSVKILSLDEDQSTRVPPP